jgi:hypothetical protein
MTARAARADLQRADFVDPRDAAAAGADFDNVDDRQHDGMTAREAADVVALRDRGFAILHEADFGGRAAHIEREHVLVAEVAADFRCRDDAADRSRLHHVHRDAFGGFRRHRAAVGLHDQEPAVEGEFA